MHIINKIIYAIVYVVSLPVEFIYEKLRGVDFSIMNSNYVGEGRLDYEATIWFDRNTVGNWLAGKITRDDSIIDIGCGKGRMLYFFSNFPFRKIGGLEYSQELADVARRNMQVLGMIAGRGREVEIINGDAVTYQNYDDYNYFYLFNPFTDIILRPFLENVKTSRLRRPRKILVIYLNPEQHTVMIEAGFKLEEEIRILGRLKCFVYSYGNE